MAHMIYTNDKGFVQGNTWHGVPQYVCQDTPVTMEQAREVMNYPLAFAPLYAKLPDGREVRSGARSIYRTDTNDVLVPAVGKDFTLMGNGDLLDFVYQQLLKPYNELSIESVGTLENGRTAFVNIKLAEWAVKGDASKTVSRLMYYNPLGRGSYRVCAHDVRIVCNNTLRMAESQGAAKKTLLKVRHTRGAEKKIADHLINLAEVRMGLELHQQRLNWLAERDMTVKQVEEFLNELIPLPKDDGASKTLATAKQNEVMSIFMRGQEGLDARTATSAYGMLNAVTNWIDHEPPKRGNDGTAILWDGIVGRRAELKDKALVLLSK